LNIPATLLAEAHLVAGEDDDMHLLSIYDLINNELYHRTHTKVMLRCLNSDGAVLAMAKVHEAIYGTHQLASKMKWLFRRSRFYWPSMFVDCFKYYKECQVCKKSVIYKWFLLPNYIPLSSLAPLEARVWTLWAKFIHYRPRSIGLYYQLLTISPNGPKLLP
jgi:hypothetical protein